MRFFITLFSLFSFVNLSFAQVANSRLYLAIDDYGDDARNYLNRVGNRDAKVILGEFIYPDKPDLGKESTVNVKVLSDYIQKIFPNKNATGIGVLDWEGRCFNLLTVLPSNHPVYREILDQFLLAIKIAKSLRPNVSWGYYGIPFKRGNFNNDAAWTTNNQKIAPLLQACDIFCPNLYGYNPSDLGNIGDVKASIKLGLDYNKKVFPLVWHRYNGGAQINYKLKRIPKNRFVNYVKEISNTTYNGKKVDGVIWWAKDIYFYVGKFSPVKKEAPNLDMFRSYYDNVIIGYSNEVIKSIK